VDTRDIEMLHRLLYADDHTSTAEARAIIVAHAIDQGLVWIAISEQKIVGYVLCQLFDASHHYFPNSIFIEGLYVLEPYRKQGIARQLIEQAMNADYPAAYRSFAITHDPKEAWLSSYYETFGFREIGKTDAGNVMMTKTRTPCR